MWQSCKNLLCIRADNMGDLLMSSPAIRALKETFGCRITLLTSSMAKPITPYIGEIDDVIECNAPWVKTPAGVDSEQLLSLVEELKGRQFDGAVIFTVYSQSALPAAMLACMACIPQRLAYSRENPYDLLTDWVPDNEPYRFILHQVTRDLKLVAAIGADTRDTRLSLSVSKAAGNCAKKKLAVEGVDLDRPFLLFHPGVSEEKRQYPLSSWVELTRRVRESLALPILVSGSEKEADLATEIAINSGTGVHPVAGLLDLGEFIAVIDKASLVVSVNTATIHIAAATQTPVVVLYALTNPQHTPWNVPGCVFPYSVPESLRSRNTVVEYVRNTLFNKYVPCPDPVEISAAIEKLLALGRTG